MQVVVAHSNLDFDSLAAAFAVTKLWPGTAMVVGHNQSANVKEFLSLYRDHLPLVDLDYVDSSSIKHIFIVDCQHIDRLEEPVRKLISDGCSYTVFDHHQPVEASLAPAGSGDSIIRQAGACTSLLVEQLIKRGVRLTAFEATLLAIGIYEDSGCLTYGGTTAADAACVAYLIEQGADLNQVSTFINGKLNAEQTELLQRLINNCRVVTKYDTKVAVATAECDRYMEGLATLTRRLLETSAADAAVTAVFMRDRIHLVGRSDTQALDVRMMARAFGGDGHRGAASAVVKNEAIESVMQRVVHWVENNVSPPVTAGQIMRSPARTIESDKTIQDAERLMTRYDENGLVVTENNKIVGVISKRDIDKAVHHHLSHAPVKGFMSRPVISAGLNTPLSEIQSLMVRHDIGRLPVVDDDGVFRGIVTRREVLRTLFGGTVNGNGLPRGRIDKRMTNWVNKLNKLDPANAWLFREIGVMASRLSMKAYAVGGCVRDLWLSRPNFDLDFMVEGNAIELAHALEEIYPGRFTVVAEHERFQTATVMFYAGDRREVDLSTARIEFYERPAALPTVEPSVLEHDLYRRDFTINALALCLNPDAFAELVDYFDGVGDLEKRTIRVLHQFSFVEDPTRIIRAVRFATRLGFRLEDETRRQAERAAAEGIFDNLGGFRLKEELKLVLRSPQRMEALDLLEKLGGGLRYLDSRLVYDAATKAALRRAQRLLARNFVDESWIVYLGVLLSPLSEDDVSAVMERLVLSNSEREWIRDGLALSRRLESPAAAAESAPAEIYKLVHGHSDQSLAMAAALGLPGLRVRRWIKLYLDKLRHVRVFMTGHDLLQAGLPEGPEIGRALEQLKEAKLAGKVKTAAQEMAFICENYGQYLVRKSAELHQ